MNKGPHLSVPETVALLERWKVVLREFAAREEKLTREHHTRNEATRRRHQQDWLRQEAEQADQLSQARAALEQQRLHLESRSAGRRRRLEKADKASRKQSADRIDLEEGNRKYKVQTGVLETKKSSDEALARNEAALAEFKRQWVETDNALYAVEQGSQKALRGFRGFRRKLKPEPGVAAEPEEDPTRALAQLRELLREAATDLAAFQKLFPARLFSALPLSRWLALIAVFAVACSPPAHRLGLHLLDTRTGLMAAGGAFVAVMALFLIARSLISSRALALAEKVRRATRGQKRAGELAQAVHDREVGRIEQAARERTESLQKMWSEALAQAAENRAAGPGQLDEKARRARATWERQEVAERQKFERRQLVSVENLEQSTLAWRNQFAAEHEGRLGRFETEHRENWARLEEDWRRAVQPLEEETARAVEAARLSFPPWTSALAEGWVPPSTFSNAALLGRLEVDLKSLAEQFPRDARLGFSPRLDLPLVLKQPAESSLLIETNSPDTAPAAVLLNDTILRLLASAPAGKMSFTLIDPVKLGQNFATVMHLADYEDNIINGRIWTQPTQIEEKLAELNEHMEKVIQMYLRNDYATIAEYNEEAGNIAEKYHFLVVADFPAGFSEGAIRRLLRIAASGARCGVYTLIHWDRRVPMPPDLLADDLRRSSVCLNGAGAYFVLAQPLVPGTRVISETPPAPEVATGFLHRLGEAGRGSNRVEVPFDQVAPASPEIWTEDTAEELRVPIGRSGATKLQYLSIGQGTRQHALIAGKTGSGKSTLFHVIITNLALWCRPEQVEFYLVDFKKGVEFKSYAARRLPHARVVAIESDREFGLSVLQRLDDELRRRGDLFRRAGVQDLAGYRRVSGGEPMPRTLLLIDEFQEFFVEDDRISQTANVLLDRIVRQGRAFGLHVILGSQTLGGAYTLARATLGQMVIRIALQCNEADAYLIMDESNPAPRLLTRPGEGIYNDMAGAIQANSPFQAVWLSDQERDARLEQIRARAEADGMAVSRGPIVFEGNAPSDAAENSELSQALESRPASNPAEARAWLGAPNSIKGPTAGVFRLRTGNNLLIVGQREEAIVSMIGLSLVALAAQYPREGARFFLFDSTAPGSVERELLDGVMKIIPQEIVSGRSADLAELMNRLEKELVDRTSPEGAREPAIFLVIHGLQNFRKFRAEDDFSFSSEGGTSPAVQLQKLMSEGPAHGIHVIATIDTYNNVNRFLGRKGLSEFEMRVLFQMSANDSASLCDDPKAGALGLHRALLFNEQEGYLETFRPYARPAAAWIERAGRQLAGNA